MLSRLLSFLLVMIAAPSLALRLSVRQQAPLRRRIVNMMRAASSEVSHVAATGEAPAKFLKHKVIFVLGGPGSGKGTQCDRLTREFGFTHLSAGDLLRTARQSGSEQGQMIDDFIKLGKIVPVAVSLGLLKTAMDEARSSNVFLVDGFPRNADNVDGWNEVMAHTAEVLCVIFMDCSQAEQEKRVLSRGLTSGRTDDNLASAKKRFATYESETLPVVKVYEQLGLLRTIPAETDPDSVYAITREAVLPFVNSKEK